MGQHNYRRRLHPNHCCHKLKSDTPNRAPGAPSERGFAVLQRKKVEAFTDGLSKSFIVQALILFFAWFVTCCLSRGWLIQASILRNDKYLDRQLSSDDQYRQYH